MLLILAALVQAVATLGALDLRWLVPLDAPPAASAAYDANSAYVPVRGGALVAVDLDRGTIRWRRDLATGIAPSSGDGLVFVASEGQVQALAPATGATRWRTSLPGTLVTITWDNSWLLCSTSAGDSGGASRIGWRVGVAGGTRCDAGRASGRRPRPRVRPARWRPGAVARTGHRRPLVGARAARARHGAAGRGFATDRWHHRQRGVQPRSGHRTPALAVARRWRSAGPAASDDRHVYFARARQRPPGRQSPLGQPALDGRTAVPTGRRSTAAARRGGRAASTSVRRLRPRPPARPSVDRGDGRDQRRAAHRLHARPTGATCRARSRRTDAGLRTPLRRSPGQARSLPGQACRFP